MSVSMQTTSRSARRPSSIIASASARASSIVFMNAPSPTLTSRTIASAPPASFLDMMLAAISETLSTVAVTSRSAYKRLSAGTRFALWPMIARPISRTWATNSLGGQLDPVAGDRLELVDRAAGVAEPAAAHLPERDAAGGDDRPDGDRRLVADAAGRVLVDAACARSRAPEVDRLAARDHRVGERVRLGARQAPEVDGHQEGGHLVVGNLVPRV